MSRPAKSPLFKVQIDGAARGNPGPAGVGIVISNEAGKRLKELAIYLGEATNNVAETCALILSLQEVSRLGAKRVAVLTDSELLARQVTGVYRVRDTQLQWLHVLIQNLIAGLDRFEIQHVPREKNRVADRLANRAVSEALRKRRMI